MRITRNQLRQMINEELLREADLGEGSVEILGRLNRIESKLDDILQAVRPGGDPQRDITAQATRAADHRFGRR